MLSTVRSALVFFLFLFAGSAFAQNGFSYPLGAKDVSISEKASLSVRYTNHGKDTTSSGYVFLNFKLKRIENDGKVDRFVTELQLGYREPREVIFVEGGSEKFLFFKTEKFALSSTMKVRGSTYSLKRNNYLKIWVSGKGDVGATYHFTLITSD
ncbi:MAG: hypothetical protein ACPGO5_05335 [Patescibacteria group bacterium]